MGILFDGAFDTYYHALGGTGICEEANLTQPSLVEKIHRQYVAAGAQAIKTNTFGTVDAALIRAGFHIAVRAAQGARVFCDIGPKREEPEQAYLMAARAFLEEGGTDFLFETLPEMEELLPALKEIKERRPDSFVIVSFAVDQDGFTSRGRHLRSLFAEACQCPYIDGVGMNCIIGAAHMARLFDQVSSKKPVAVMPNAGHPSRATFDDNVAYFAQKVAEMYGKGATITGGCCGTTPSHIAALKRELAQVTPARISALSQPVRQTAPLPEFKQGKLIIAEVDPPAGVDFDGVMRSSAELLAAGAHMLSVGDSPMARPRCDAMMLAARLRRELKADVIPHITCRDRNHIAMKGVLLGAAMEGIDKVLVVRGDSVAKVERESVDGVFSFNSHHLIEFVQNLNENLFERGFLIAAALNINARSFNSELARAQKKRELGAQMFITQPVYTKPSIENLRRAKEELKCPLIAGLMPLASYKNALFINNEAPGITIPDRVMERLKNASPASVPDITAEECLRLAEETAGTCDGYFVTTPLKRVDITAKLISQLGGIK